MPLRGRLSWREPDAVDGAAADVRDVARPVTGPDDVGDLVDRLANRQYVLLGEASHGTSEFYRWRAKLTARLIREADFDFVAVEGDWPACYDLTRFVRGDDSAPDDVESALRTFERWPTWMWANWETAAFLSWLRGHNAVTGADVGFYGLDVYSLFESLEAVLAYLEENDPDAAAHAREAVRCFSPYETGQEYGRETPVVPGRCEREVVELLAELRRDREVAGDGRDERFAAEQNALVAKNAEDYYRTMMTGRGDSWNVRDEHMVETLSRLVDHHDDGKAVVWAHNTHVGDARATDMASNGRVNVGQLVRERNPADEVGVVGFATHHGSVVAADAWGEQMREMPVPEAKAGSYEDVFHRAGARDRLLFTDDVAADGRLAEPRGHRAIGVVYRPEMESGNYVPTDLRERYDALVYVDETTALHPLAMAPDAASVPDLYPTGL